MNTWNYGRLYAIKRFPNRIFSGQFSRSVLNQHPILVAKQRKISLQKLTGIELCSLNTVNEVQWEGKYTEEDIRFLFIILFLRVFFYKCKQAHATVTV